MINILNDEVIEIESIPTKIKYKGIVWIPEQSKTNYDKKKGNPKKPYIIKWVAKKDAGDIFTKDDFFKEFPKHRNDGACKKRIDEAILNMILDKCIEVHDNVPGKYRVLK